MPSSGRQTPALDESREPCAVAGTTTRPTNTTTRNANQSQHRRRGTAADGISISAPIDVPHRRLSPDLRWLVAVTQASMRMPHLRGVPLEQESLVRSGLGSYDTGQDRTAKTGVRGSIRVKNRKHRRSSETSDDLRGRQVIGSGQGRGRTADLPIFRRRGALSGNATESSSLARSAGPAGRRDTESRRASDRSTMFREQSVSKPQTDEPLIRRCVVVGVHAAHLRFAPLTEGKSEPVRAGCRGQTGVNPLRSPPEVTRKVYAHLMRKATAAQVEAASELLTQHRKPGAQDSAFVAGVSNS
jgi:hypothetical protein